MACARPAFNEPISGGLDSREHRGVGRPQDFELLLNVNGGQEEGYTTRMGWKKYLWDRTCQAGYTNADLHDQMADMRSVVNITPTVTVIPAQPAVPWKLWTIDVKPDVHAQETGVLQVRVSYASSGGAGQSQVMVDVLGTVAQTLSLPLPGDATAIQVIRLVGTIESNLVETATSTDTGTGVIVEVADTVCTSLAPYKRKPLTLLRSVSAQNGRRHLVAATNRTIYVNNDNSGNWRVIADGLGDACLSSVDDRFAMETLGDIAIFTNGLDPIISFNLHDLPAGEHYWSADYMADLQALRISSARVIGKLGGFILIGDVVADAQVQSSRIYWCDYNDPLSWVPGGESAAGYHDFGLGERVLAMLPIGGSLRVYTTKAIYDGRIVEDERIFAFEELYRSDDGAALPAYPNTVVAALDMHFYLGTDSIYVMSTWDRTPRREEALHVASGVIFRGLSARTLTGYTGIPTYGPIDKSACRSAVAGYDSVSKAVWFSWPAEGYSENSHTLVLWPTYGKASIVDQGFTAFCTHRPYLTPSLRDWLDSLGICSAVNMVLQKEGMPCDLGNPLEEFSSLYNPSKSTADPMDPDSVIAATCSECVADLCTNCDSDARFLFATAGEDVSIKEFTGCGVRERFDQMKVAPIPLTGEGCYSDQAYPWILQKRMSRWGQDAEKTVTHLKFNVSTLSTLDNEKPTISAQVGVSGCSDLTRWSTAVERVTCDGSIHTLPDLGSMNIRHKNSLSFPFYQKGEFVSYRLFGDGLGDCVSIAGETMMILVDKC